MNTAKSTDPIWDSRNSDEPGDQISGQRRPDQLRMNLATQLEALIAQLCRAPGKQAFQGLCIFPGGRARAIFRWGAINFASLSELEDYCEESKPGTTIGTAAGNRVEHNTEAPDSVDSLDPS